MGSDKKRLAVNMTSQIMAFALNIAVSFFLTRFIVSRLGAEVYGFVGVANNLIDYVAVFTVAFNGMLGRYVIIELTKNNIDKCNEYFSSVTIFNLVSSAVFLFPCLLFALNIDKFINIAPHHIPDIRMLVTFTLFSFLISLSTGSLFVSTYATNRLDLSSRRQMESTILRVILLVLLFLFFPAHVWFVGLASTICAMFIARANLQYKNQLLPSLKLSRKHFRLAALKELISVGIWNSVNKLSQILITGLDLLIANLFVNPHAMGLLSISKALPTQIVAFYGMVANVFSPQMTVLYGKGDKSSLLKEISFSMRATGFVSAVPCMGLIVFGTAFYRLWLPDLSEASIAQIHTLSVLTLFPSIISSYIYPLYNINTITLKLKIPVIVMLGIGIASTTLVLILLNTTSLGVYAIAGVSSVFLLIRSITFSPIYAAKNLKLKWYAFYPQLLHGIFNIAIIYALFYVVRLIIPIYSWGRLIFVAGFCALIGYAVSGFTLFSMNEINAVVTRIWSRMLLFGETFRKRKRNSIERKKLKNNNFSILSNSNIGGIIFHDLGLEVLSPTVGLYIEPHDFVKFLSNLDFYINQELVEFESFKDYPMGKLFDILIHFRYYETYKQALDKWNERKKTINYNNLFIVMTDRFFCSYEDALKFDKLPYKNKILFISGEKNWPEISCAITMRKHNDKKRGCIGIITDIVNLFGKRMYQQSGFDYIKWLNNPEKFMVEQKNKKRKIL